MQFLFKPVEERKEGRGIGEGRLLNGGKPTCHAMHRSIDRGSERDRQEPVREGTALCRLDATASEAVLPSFARCPATHPKSAKPAPVGGSVLEIQAFRL